MDAAFAGAILVEEPLEFTFDKGMFYFRRSGGPACVMRPNTFFATVAAAASEGRKFKFGGAEIVAFPGKAKTGH